MPRNAPAPTCNGVCPRSSFNFLSLTGCPWNKSSTIMFNTCMSNTLPSLGPCCHFYTQPTSHPTKEDLIRFYVIDQLFFFFFRNPDKSMNSSCTKRFGATENSQSSNFQRLSLHVAVDVTKLLPHCK
jgi:hypothetical protein